MNSYLKVLFFALLTVIVTSCNRPEKSPFCEIYEQLEGEDQTLTLKFSPGFIKMMVSDEPELKRLLNEVDQVRLVVSEEQNHLNQKWSNLLKDTRYEDLMVVQDEGDQIRVRLLKEGNTIHEVLLLVQSDEEMVMVGLQGKISMTTIKEVLNESNIKELVSIN